MKLKIDWEKAADSLAADVGRQKAEIARMRPVYRAAMRWYKDPNTGTGYESEMDLTHACARAARKGKGKAK